MDAALTPATSKSLYGIVVAASCVGSCSALKASSLLYQAWEASKHIGDDTGSVIHQFWWVGALTTMVGATLTIVGLMIQKTSHGHPTADEEKTYYWLSWRWVLGFLVWLTGQGVCWTADGLANRSLLACFNCWNIVVVFVVAPWYLGESVEQMASVGALITFGGCIWVVLTGPRSYQLQTVAKLQDSWLCLPVLCLLAVSLLLAIALAMRARMAKRSRGLVPLQLAALSAIFAWYAVLFSKCASTLAVTSVHSRNQFGHWQFWAYLACMAAFAVCQVHTLNMALKVGTAVSVLPAYESLSMMGQIVICGVFFEEFRGFEATSYLGFSCAIACVLVGITVMTGATSVGSARAQDPTAAFDTRTSLTSARCKPRTGIAEFCGAVQE
mmetsp:Transcript_74119/g.217504  ORF Transcript_74119/g.217504 Transcript_74119/m.217504 type:complete len:384 (+) Transcript_74119:139-1290(+)